VSTEVSNRRVRGVAPDEAPRVPPAPHGALGWLAATARRAVVGGLSIFVKQRRARAAVKAEREHLRRLDFAEEFARGYLAGWKECLLACQEAIEEGHDGGWSN
jgi:hypothetical protein